MVDTYRISKDKKVVQEAEGLAGGQASLDSFYISVQNESKPRFERGVFSRWKVEQSHKKERFPDHERWHTLQFREFAESVLDGGFNYLGVDWLGNIQCVSGEFNPRWCREYQRRTKARIYSFAESCINEVGCGLTESGHTSVSAAWFGTLTVRHPVTGSYVSHKATVDALRDSWKSIRRWISSKGWRYLRVMEPGEDNGYAHYHMVVLGASQEEIEELKLRWVKACNKHGNKASLKAQHWELVENIRNVGAYIAKYVCKPLEPGTWWRWMELCYREHVRVYAMDMKSSRYIKRKYPVKPTGIGKTDFVFDGEQELELTEPDLEPEEPRREPSQSIESRSDQDSGGRAMDTLNGYPLARPILSGVRGVVPDQGPGRSPRLTFPESPRRPARSGGVVIG